LLEPTLCSIFESFIDWSGMLLNDWKKTFKLIIKKKIGSNHII
jgi:hypothetical protein